MALSQLSGCIEVRELGIDRLRDQGYEQSLLRSV